MSRQTLKSTLRHDYKQINDYKQIRLKKVITLRWGNGRLLECTED